MVFAGISYQAPGVHASNETLENVVSFGDPLFANFFKGQAWIGKTAQDLGVPATDPERRFLLGASAITKATSAVVTVGANHGLKVNDRLHFGLDVGGMLEIRNLIGTVTAIGGSPFTTVTVGINSSGFTAHTSGGTVILLDPAKNVLRPGLLLGYHTANKEWLPYAPGASDGTQNVRGVLYVEVQMNLPSGSTAQRWRGHIMWGGPVRAAALIQPGSAQIGLAHAPDASTIRTAMAGRWYLDDYFQQ